METAFTDEQRLLLDTVTQFAGDFRAVPETIAEQRAHAAGWETIAELGLLTMRWPESAGGAGAATADVALIAQALARAPAVVPFVGPTLAAELLFCCDLPPDALQAAVDIGPLTIGLDADTLELPAARPVAWDAAGATQAASVIDADSERIVVATTLADAIPLPSADVSRVALAPSDHATVTRLGAISADGFDRWRAFSLTVISADLVGTMAGAVDLAVGYAKERTQFGKPIGAFQALAHMLADAHVHLEAARSATNHAAWATDHLAASDALLAARVAKAYAARTALGVAEVAVQIHGGIGTTWESACHLFVRRALTGQAILGDEQRQLREIATVRLGGG